LTPEDVVEGVVAGESEDSRTDVERRTFRFNAGGILIRPELEESGEEIGVRGL